MARPPSGAVRRAMDEARPAVIDVMTDEEARPPLNQYLFRPGQAASGDL